MDLKHGGRAGNPSHHLISTPTERGTDEDEMQVDFSDLHSTRVDSLCRKRKKKCLPFLSSGILSTIPGSENISEKI